MSYSKVTITLNGYTWNHILSEELALSSESFWKSKGATVSVKPHEVETKSVIRASVEMVLRRLRT